MLHCPYLPDAQEPFIVRDSPSNERPEDRLNYRMEFAQSYLTLGKPAQALLQLNHALAVDILDGDIYRESSPYRAIAFILCNASASDGFLGNPVRHYQHLATRIPPHQPLAELRALRAWACFHIAESILPPEHFPKDTRQIEKEKLEIPSLEVVLDTSPICDREHELAEIRSCLVN